MNLDQIKNFGELFVESMNSYGERPVLQWKEGMEYKSVNAKRLIELVDNLSETIEKMGFSAFDKAAIISENRYEWVVADFACIFSRIITVPIYTTMTAEQIEYILRHSEARLCFVSSSLMLEKVI